MTAGENELDPIIHAQTRLRIVATLATLPEGDSLSFTRLQRLLGLTPGNLITHLRKLEEAQYVASSRSSQDGSTHTSVHLTHAGRAALDRYSTTLRQILNPTPPR